MYTIQTKRQVWVPRATAEGVAHINGRKVWSGVFPVWLSRTPSGFWETPRQGPSFWIPPRPDAPQLAWYPGLGWYPLPSRQEFSKGSSDLPKKSHTFGTIPPLKRALPALLLGGAAGLFTWALEGAGFGSTWDWSSQGRAIWNHGEWWRLLTGMMLHGGFAHWLSNMFLFLVFGWLLRGHFGRLAFPTVPLLAGLLGQAVTISLYPPHVHLVGLSGMVYAMAAMWCVLYMWHEKSLSLVQKGLRVLFFCSLSLLPQGTDPQVSHLAHGMGFLMGLVGGLLLGPWVSPKKSA